MPNNPFEPMIKNIGDYVSGTLYAQGVIPPIGIGNYEGLALSSPADTHLLAAKDPVIDEIAVGMTGNEINADFVTGTPPLTLSDSKGYPLQWWQVNLSPYQNLNGYNAPWPSGGGKNKLGLSNIGRTVHGLKWEDKNTYYSISGTCNESFSTTYIIGSSGNAINLEIPANTQCVISLAFSGTPSSWNMQQIINGAYAQIDINGTESNYTAGVPFTLENAGTLKYIRSSVSLAFSQNRTYDIKAYVQLEYASSATSFAPYSNICPILGTDKLNMFVEESYDPSATPKAVITLPETIYNGEVFAGGAVSRTATITFTGADSENWSAYLDNGFSIVIDNMQEGRRQQGRTNWLKVDTVGISEDNLAWLGVANKRLYAVRVSALLPEFTISAWKEYLALHPLQVEYPLATPTTPTLSTPSIPTPTGNATTWATAEDGVVDSMEVTYIKSE